MFLVERDDAGRDAGAIKKVRGQGDDALDIAFLNNSLADLGLDVAPEEHAMGHNDRAFAGAFERRDKVEKKGIVAVLLGRHAIDKAAKFVVLWVEAVAPSLI